MTKKTARRWIKRHEWQLAREEATQSFSKPLQKEFVKCLRILKYKI